MGWGQGNWALILCSYSYASCSHFYNYVYIFPSSSAAPHMHSSSTPHARTPASAFPPEPALIPVTSPVQLLRTPSLIIRKKINALRSSIQCLPFTVAQSQGKVKPKTEKLDFLRKEMPSLVTVVGPIPLLGCLSTWEMFWKTRFISTPPPHLCHNKKFKFPLVPSLLSSPITNMSPYISRQLPVQHSNCPCQDQLQPSLSSNGYLSTSQLQPVLSSLFPLCLQMAFPGLQPPYCPAHGPQKRKAEVIPVFSQTRQDSSAFLRVSWSIGRCSLS